LSPAVAPLAFTLILGKVNLPSASLQSNILPACAATVNVVSAVKLTVIPGPVLVKPFLEMTGPENVVFAIVLSS
jgi:hypothetical protein